VVKVSGTGIAASGRSETPPMTRHRVTRPPNQRRRLVGMLVGTFLLMALGAEATAQRAFWRLDELQTGALGKALALGGDLDGDGFGDILVAQPEWTGGNNRGKVQARGSRLSVPIHVWSGEVDGDQFGFSVAIARDVDGDGLGDALIGAPFHDGPAGEDAGRVYLFSGGSGALLRVWDGETPFAHFGHAVATLGDRNRDGVVDLAIGAPGHAGSKGPASGKVTFFSGRTGGLLGALEGDQAGQSFGFSISGSGDIDRDGSSDVVIGSPSWRDGNGEPVGKAEVFSGRTGEGIRTLPGTWREGRFGWSVAIPGDIDGDGADDILVGGPGYGRLTGPNTGEARLYSGRTGVVLRSVVGSARGDETGTSVARAGDLDLDGYEDFAVGSPGRMTVALQAGSAAVLSGRTGNPIWTGQGDEEGGRFGEAIVGGADVNRDGMPEVAVGAPGEGVVRGGRLHVVGRPPDCLDFWDGTETRRLFGGQMTSAGDVDGDGHDDVVIGAPHGNGSVSVFSGRTRELLWQMMGHQVPNWAPLSRQGRTLTGMVCLMSPSALRGFRTK